MPWFKVDDGFWSHPKVIACPLPAIGLWVRAGSWSAQQLTDGVIPRVALQMLGARPKDAAALVTAGLWVVEGQGWRFHDWETYQPTRATVEAERAATAARVAAWRQRKRKPGGGGGDDGGPDLRVVGIGE